MVAVQDFQKVVFNAGRSSDLVKESCGAILAVDIFFLIGHPASPSRT